MKMNKILAAGIAATLAVTSLSAVVSAEVKEMTFNMGVTSGTIELKDLQVAYFTDNSKIAVKEDNKEDDIKKDVENAIKRERGTDPGAPLAVDTTKIRNTYWNGYYEAVDKIVSDEQNKVGFADKEKALSEAAEIWARKSFVGDSDALAKLVGPTISAECVGGKLDNSAVIEYLVTNGYITAADVAAATNKYDFYIRALDFLSNSKTDDYFGKGAVAGLDLASDTTDDFTKAVGTAFKAYDKLRTEKASITRASVLKVAANKTAAETAAAVASRSLELKLESEIREAYKNLPVEKSDLITQAGSLIVVPTYADGYGEITSATLKVTGRQNGSTVETTVTYPLTCDYNKNLACKAYEIDLCTYYVNKPGTINLNSYSAITGMNLTVNIKKTTTSASVYDGAGSGYWGKGNNFAKVIFSPSAAATTAAVNEINGGDWGRRGAGNGGNQGVVGATGYAAAMAGFTDENMREIYNALGTSILADAWYNNSKTTAVAYPLLYKTDWYTTDPRVYAPDNTLRRDEIFLLSDTGAYQSISAIQMGNGTTDAPNRDTGAKNVTNNNIEGYHEIPQAFAGLASQVAGFFNKHQNGKIEFTFTAQAAASTTEWLSGGIPSTEVGLRNYLGDASARDFVLFFNYSNSSGELQAETALDIDAGVVTFVIDDILDKLGGYTIGVVENLYYGMTKGVTTYGDAQLSVDQAVQTIAHANVAAPGGTVGSAKMPALKVTQVKLSYDEDADVAAEAEDVIVPEIEEIEEEEIDLEPDVIDDIDEEEDFEEDEADFDEEDEDFADDEDEDFADDEEDFADDEEDFADDEEDFEDDFADDEEDFADEETDEDDVPVIDEEDFDEPADEPETIDPIDEDDDNTVTIDDDTNGSVAPTPVVVVEDTEDENPGTGVALAVVPALAAAAVIAVSKKRK